MQGDYIGFKTQKEQIEASFPEARERIEALLKDIYGADFATGSFTILLHNDSGATLVNHFYENNHAEQKTT